MTYERIIGLHVIDEEAYQAYRSKMEPILNSVGASFGYDFKISEVLKSKTENEINRVFTIDFPSKECMDTFFEREDYLGIKAQHLDQAIQSKTVISLHEKN